MSFLHSTGIDKSKKDTMKKLSLILLSLLLLSPTLGFSKSYRVKGYSSKRGYVAPHYRSKRDGKKWNNWSSKGNYNPYTGKKGRKRWY
jgi:hypothetical protein